MEKRLKTSQAIGFLIENQKFHYTCSVNRVSRTRGSSFSKFFWGKNYLRRKIHLLGFYIKMEKRLKTSQETGFLIENQKSHYTCSVNRVSRTCGSTFSRFFWDKKYQREQAQLFQNYIKNEKPLKTSSNIGFFTETWKIHVFFHCCPDRQSKNSTKKNFFWAFWVGNSQP